METLTIKLDEVRLAAVVAQAVKDALADSQAHVFTKKQAAKYLGISHVTLWKWECSGVIKPIRLGDRELYTKAELDKFLDAARLKAEAA